MEIQNLDEFLKYYANLRARTMRVAECIPAESIEWGPAEGRWTNGDIVRHLAAIERYMYAETIQGNPHRYAGCGTDLAEGRDAVLDYMRCTHDEPMASCGALTPEMLQAKVYTPAGNPISAWKWLRAMCEHEVHHRGQLYTHLGILGVETPPIFGLRAEQLSAQL